MSHKNQIKSKTNLKSKHQQFNFKQTKFKSEFDEFERNVSNLRGRSLDEVVDEVSLLVADDHPGPLVRLQPQGLQGELLKEFHPRIASFAQQLHFADLGSNSIQINPFRITTKENQFIYSQS